MKRTALSIAFWASVAGLLATFSTTSCQKDETAGDPAETVCRLTRINNGPDEYVAYTHDAQGRVVRAQSSDGSYATYAYETGTIEVEYYDETGVLNSWRTCTLNADGNVSESVIGDELWQMTYDADGYLTQIKSTSGSDTSVVNVVVQNGNLVSATGYNNEGRTWEQLFTYYTEQDDHWENKGGVINVASSYPMFDDEGTIYPLPVGKVSTHLVKTFVAYENGQEERSFGLEYELNANGYVATAVFSADFAPASYEYECQ